MTIYSHNFGSMFKFLFSLTNFEVKIIDDYMYALQKNITKRTSFNGPYSKRPGTTSQNWWINTYAYNLY